MNITHLLNLKVPEQSHLQFKMFIVSIYFRKVSISDRLTNKEVSDRVKQ